MSGNAGKQIDWHRQRTGLEAAQRKADPLPASATYFGYAGPKQAGDGNGSSRKSHGVHWSPVASEQQPCVALLRHYPAPGRPRVLILPGATAWRGTFFQPERGLIGRLNDAFDVWTLDWRGTKVITDVWRGCKRASVPAEIEQMSLGAIASEELPAAVEHIRLSSEDRAGSIALLGHCVGSAVAALAIARGDLEQCSGDGARAGDRPKAILSTIGLFYRGAVDTWLRANERIDESTPDEFEPDPWYIDFAVDAGGEHAEWPEFYENFYGLWTKTPYPHCQLSFCRRISSIIGAPYRPDDIGYLHDDEHNGLGAQFGVLPLALLDDIARAVRRGYIDADLVANGGQARARDHFRAFDLTLLTGSENQLWHRDSIDRMYEWLRRGGEMAVEKRIFERYGHQDLWWSPRAKERHGVYDYVVSRLG
jgi:hypothetical protein